MDGGGLIRAPGEGTVRIGLINNMPDAAFDATARQFTALMARALYPRPCRLVCFTMPGIARGTGIASRHLSADQLRDWPLDLLIVSGATPLQADLRSESYWPGLTSIIDRAVLLGLPMIFSCLAAHAAVLHLDGIWRQRLPEKRSGVYAQNADPADPVATGLNRPFSMPHSRWNGIDADALLARGYRIVSRDGCEVDIFVRNSGPPMLFLRGHPEYDARSLLLEYQRDMRLYFDGALSQQPKVPANYFGAETEEKLRAVTRCAPDPRIGLAAILANAQPANTWRADAELICRNWLDQALASRTARSEEHRIFA
jgi:homoserine O-succinyltransferase